VVPVAAAPGGPPGNPNGAFRYDGAMFATRCTYSHSAADDPIVSPGRPGAAHRHDFFGNPDADAFSTARSLLRAGDTTCDMPADTASYWTPALLDRGTPVRPEHGDVYYRVAPGVRRRAVRSYPRGLVMIAGDAHATEAQPASIAGWGCGHAPATTSSVPSCPPERPLTMRVTFPDCWDGERRDSRSHTAHIAYSGPSGCPPRHPVPLPQLTLVVRYPWHGDPTGLLLSSGDPRGAHADFLNAWEPGPLATNVRACLRRGVVCSVPSPVLGSPDAT
jgi:hypothetical protein